MNKIAFLAFVVATGVSSAFAEYDLNFNTDGQFSGNFGSAQPGPIFQSGTGGLNNSGSLDLSGITGGSTTQQIITFNQPFAGNLASWSASIYYYGNAQQFWQFGVVADDTPGLADGFAHNGSGYSPAIWVESGNADGGTFGIASYDGVSESIYDTDIVAGGLPATAAWYHYAITVNYLGDSTFDLSGTMTKANADGSFDVVMGTTSLTVENAALAADDSVYLYLNLYDGVALDNFHTTTYTPTPVPEPATYSALAGLCVLGYVSWRRRARRA